MANPIRFKVITPTNTLLIEKYSGSPQLVVSEVDGAAYYATSVEGTFGTQDRYTTGVYDAFFAVFTDNACNETTCIVQEFCDWAWKDVFKGIILRNDIKLCKSKCSVEFKVSANDLDACLKRNWEKQINFYGLDSVTVAGQDDALVSQTYIEAVRLESEYGISPIFPPILNEPGIVVGFYEGLCGSSENPLPCNNFANTFSDIIPFNSNQVCKFGQEGIDCGSPPDPQCNPNTTYHYFGREVTFTNCDTNGNPVSPGYSWQLLENTCAIDGKAKWWRCPTNFFFEDLGGGRLLKDVINYVALETLNGCGIECAVSDFFNLNPQGTAPSNYAYDKALQFLPLTTIHQKSDVKRPNATQPAASSKFSISLKELIENLRAMFNIKYDFVTNGIQTCLRIEHVSFYEQVGDVDVRAAYIESNGCCIKYADNLPRYITFASMDGESSTDKADFRGGKMIDFGNCTEGNQDHASGLIDTDIGYITTNPDTISDDGFVLIHNEYVSTNGNCIAGVDIGKISGTANVNAHLSWANLVDAYWRHDASNFQGDYIDQADDTVYSVAHNIELVNDLSMPVCMCDFDGKEICVRPTRAHDKMIVPLNANFRSCFYDEFGYAKLTRMRVSMLTGSGVFSFKLRQVQ